MKTNKLTIALIAALSLLMSSCSEHFLDRFPDGSSILEDTYAGLNNRLEGSVRGIYALMYQSQSSGHDAFGRRSFDMYEDFLSGDMALTNYSYGWFQVDEMGRGISYHSGEAWSYYYRMIHNTNAVIRLVRDDASGVYAKINEQGLDADVYTDADIEVAAFYAQALTMRGYAYSHLGRMFVPETGYYQSKVGKIDNYEYFPPIYNEDNMDVLQSYSTGKAFYSQAYGDLELAIKIFEKWADEDAFSRESKIAADVNVARGILAYMALNKLDYATALKYSKDAIESGAHQILPNAQLLTDGFNNVNTSCWMWGQHVTPETSGGLRSFWGQVDIHSYSYAWIGDTKVIDQLIYDSIPSWDGRKEWFNDGKANPVYKYCPDKKFFSAANPTSTKADDIDREWINDDVYMRIESMYLIAAEASYYLGNYVDAQTYLNALTDERQLLSDPDAPAAYAAYKTKIASSTDELRKAIIFNWRLELWGEGYGWQTFRRLSKQIRRGGNHALNGGKEINCTDDEYNYFRVPSSEIYYNQNLDPELSKVQKATVMRHAN